MEDGEFRRGEIEIQWLERRLPSLAGNQTPEEGARLAALAAALLADEERTHRTSARASANGTSAGGSAVTITEPSVWRRAALREGLR
jgi:acetyl-CoA carboxylase biotin carboxylase subunit